MFSRNNLSNLKISDPFFNHYKGLHYTTYPAIAFASESSEETIIISRAPKLLKDSGIRFWVSAVLHDDWNDREEFKEDYIENANFIEIDEKTINQRISECCSELRVKPKIPLNPKKFVGAIEMYYFGDADCLVDLFVEYEDEYIRFYWDSTA